MLIMLNKALASLRDTFPLALTIVDAGVVLLIRDGLPSDKGHSSPRA